MIGRTSDCFGCNVCHGCRLNETRKAVFCDGCKREIGDTAYLVNAEHLCAECALDSITSISVEELINDPA